MFLSRVCSVVGYVRRVYREYLLGKYCIEISGEVKVRYGLNVLPNIPVRFGTNSILVPDT